MSMIRKYHNHKQQTTPWHREEEPLNHHETPGRLLTKFDNVIQEQLTKVVTESVNINSQDVIKHYLSRHAMI